MNEVDKQYLSLLEEIVRFGVEKDTRAGKVKSLFGKQLRFDLQKGFPLLTTKKVFTKGVIHELLWFLQRPYNSHGSMNIEYLIRNGVHIWDDDAYRWFKDKIAKEIKPTKYLVCLDDNDDEFIHNIVKRKTNFEYWIENEARLKDETWLQNITKEEFLDLTLQRVEICGSYMSRYRFGDLGPVYGTQWRHFGDTSLDQIHEIINTLKTNPNDRRMLCLAYNPSALEDMALPPCHVMFQFYARELSRDERMRIFNKRYMNGEIPKKWYEWFDEYSKDVKEGEDVALPVDGSDYDIAEIPRYALSCMWTQRSVDVPLGLPFNIASYALLTYMIAEVTNMLPDELIASLGDTHIYMNQMDGVMEQLNRKGNDQLPKLEINRKVEIIEDFKFEDFEIKGYNPDPPIKYPLSVG
jgi:thymidylate synthase